MISFICGIQKLQQTSEYNKNVAGSGARVTVGVAESGVQATGCTID